MKPPSATKDQFATVSAEIGSVIVHIDLSTARIMSQLLNRVTKVLTGDQETEKPLNRNQDDDSGKGKSSSITLGVKHFGFAWLEQLMTESFLEGSPPQTKLQLNPLDALVKINLGSITLKSQIVSQETRAMMETGAACNIAGLFQDHVACTLRRGMIGHTHRRL